MINERIYSILSSALTYTIRPIVLKQKDELPAITYQVEIDHDKTFDGNADLKVARVELNVYATTLSEAKTINTELRAAMAGVSGVAAGITVFNLYVEREIEDFETEQYEYRINTVFLVNYSEG